MDTLLHFLATHGGTLLAGSTAFLALGVLATAILRSPLHRQRVGELTILATLVWLAFACVPLPRFQFADRPVTSITESHADGVAEIPLDLLPARAEPTPARAPTPQTTTAIYRPRSAAALFLAGSVACCAWLAIGHLLLWRTLRGSTPAPGRLLCLIRPHLTHSNRSPLVLVSAHATRPMTCGFLAPKIVLPAALVAADREAQLRQILLHELAHVHQRDAWGNAVFCLAIPLLYVNPLYWWLRARVALARELVADDRAALADGKDAYAAHLVEYARAHVAPRGLCTATLGIFDTPSDFYRRMRMLLDRPAPLATRCSNGSRVLLAFACAVAIALATAVSGVRPAVAQDSSTPRSGATTPSPAEPESGRERKLREAVGNLTETQVGMVDPVMRARLLERDLTDSEIARHRAAGLGENHARLRELQSLREAQQKRIDDHLAEWRVTEVRQAEVRRPGRAPATAPAPPKVVAPPASPRTPELSSESNPFNAESRGASGGVRLDLVGLADRIVDAAGAVKVAKARHTIAGKAPTSVEEREVAQATLETAANRLELLQSIAKVALDGARRELETAELQFANGLIPPGGVDEIRARVAMLELILSRGR